MATARTLLGITSQHSTSTIATFQTFQLLPWLENLNIGKFKFFVVGNNDCLMEEQADRVSIATAELLQQTRVIAYDTIFFVFVSAGVASEVGRFKIWTVAVEVGFSFADNAFDDLLV